MIREIRDRIASECFGSDNPVVIATGGFAGLLSGAGLFEEAHPDLVLEGIKIAQELNA